MIKGDEGRGSKGALNADEGEEDDLFKAKRLSRRRPTSAAWTC